MILRAGGDPLALAQLGTQFTQGDPQGTEGYDGQFVYYLARGFQSWRRFRDRLDVPAYRYQRILLPVLARILYLGGCQTSPLDSGALGVLSHALGTWVVAVLLNFLWTRGSGMR